MFDYSKFVTEIDGITAETFSWGAIKWLCNERLLPESAQTLGICHILPGCANPLHYHPNCEELLYMLSGTGRHRFNEDWVDVKPGSTVRIPVGVRHKLVNTGWEPITCLVVFSSGNRQTVFIEE